MFVDDVVSAPGEPAELSVESQLDALFNPKDPAAAKAADPAPEGISSTPPGTPPAEEPKPEPTLEEKLAAITEEAPPEEKKLAFTPEQEQILQAIPDPATLGNILGAATTLQKFNDALSTGDFKAVESMFDPGAWEALLEHVYETRVNSAGEKSWLNRWVAEQEGGKVVSTAQRNLQAQLNKVQADLTARERREQEHNQNVQRTAALEKFNTHVEGLFDKINFSKTDRKYVVREIFEQVRNNTAARTAINQGNLNAVNSIFKKAVTEYANRNKEEAAAIDVKLKAQESKKILAGAGGGSESTPATDMATAKPEQRDGVMLNQLNALFGRK